MAKHRKQRQEIQLGYRIRSAERAILRRLYRPGQLESIQIILRWAAPQLALQHHVRRFLAKIARRLIAP